MHDRRAVQAFVTVPARRFRQRKMDLHLGAAVAKEARAFTHRGGHGLVGEQPLVQLRRRDVCDDGALGGDALAAGETHADSAPTANEHALDVLARLAHAAVIADQPHERVGKFRSAAARNREPVPARLQHFARERGEACAAETAQRLRGERKPGRRPQLRAEQSEREVGVREEALQHARPLGSQLLRVPSRRSQEERGCAIGKRGRGRQIGVQILEPARREIVAELRVRRASNPERVPRAEDVVQIAGLGELGCVNRAAEPVVSLEHADAPTGAREQCAAGKRVDAAADDDCVVVSHAFRAPMFRPSPPAARPRSTARTSSDARRDPRRCIGARRTDNRPAS